MDKDEVKAIVAREIGPLLGRLGISHWNIRVSYHAGGEDEDGTVTRGECTRLVNYDDAHLVFYPEQLADEADVLKTLRHELFHVVLAPFDLYTTAVDKLGLDDALQRVVDMVWYHAVEKAVINLERLYRGLTEA